MRESKATIDGSKIRVQEFLGQPQGLLLPEGLKIELDDVGDSEIGVFIRAELNNSLPFDFSLGLSFKSLEAIAQFFLIRLQREKLVAQVPAGKDHWDLVAKKLGKATQELGERELPWEDYLAEQSQAT